MYASFQNFKRQYETRSDRTLGFLLDQGVVGAGSQGKKIVKQ